MITSNITTIFILTNLVKWLPFQLNNLDFPPLPLPKSCSSVSVSLQYATACNSLSDKVSLLSNYVSNSTNELLPMVFGVLHGKFVPNQKLISSKSFVSHLVFNVSTKSNHQLVCNSVMSFQPVLTKLCSCTCVSACECS